MFENYVGAKTKPLRPWVIPLFFGAVGLVGMAALGLISYQLLSVSVLAAPDTELAMAAPPPSPPPPPPGAKSRPQHAPKAKVHKVKEQVQPDRQREREVADDDGAEDNLSEGIPGGVLEGIKDGVPGGVTGAPLVGLPGGAGHAPPPPPTETKIVPPHALEAQRIAGDARVVPSDTDKLAMARQGQTVVVSVVKMCLSAGGTVTSLQLLKSSGFPGYDRQIKSAMRQWRYRPFRVNGKAVPVCTPVTFQYRQNR
ncbi:MAG TPA: energy transducer TonB [Kofleriaceae bacterium]|nr:energy transducer TonB [Kofleriaceae bacterium]